MTSFTSMTGEATDRFPGDRLIDPHAADPVLGRVERRYGISYRRTLAQIIGQNTGERVQPNVFKAAG